MKRSGFNEDKQNNDYSILVIDDEEILHDILTEVLHRMGYETLAASSGKQGLVLYKKHKKDIRLVLLDILMPDMTGIETYSRLCAIDPQVRVLFMSGMSDSLFFPGFKHNNNEIYIKKPFSLEEIKQKIEQMTA